MAKSATQLLSDAEKIRKHAGLLSRVNKAASDTLKEEASKIEMRAVRRMRQRVKRRPAGSVGAVTVGQGGTHVRVT